MEDAGAGEPEGEATGDDAEAGEPDGGAVAGADPDWDTAGEDAGAGEPEGEATGDDAGGGEPDGGAVAGADPVGDAAGDDTGGGELDGDADALADPDGDATDEVTGDFVPINDYLDYDDFVYFDCTLGDDFYVTVGDFKAGVETTEEFFLLIVDNFYFSYTTELIGVVIALDEDLSFSKIT